MIWILGQFWDKKADALEERLGPDASALADVLRDFALGANGKTAKKAFSRLLKKCRRQGKRHKGKGRTCRIG